MSTAEFRVELPSGMTGDEAKILLAIKLYEVGKASLGQAAKMAGFSTKAFMEVLGHHRVPVFSQSPEELRQDLES